MQKVVALNTRTTTITLTGECEVEFTTPHTYFEVYNESSADVVASIYPEKKKGDDGAITVHPGGSATLPVLKPNTYILYLQGTGKVQVVGKSSPVAVFNAVAVTFTGGGGGDTTIIVPDDHEYATEEDIDNMFGPDPEPDPGPDFASKEDIDNLFKNKAYVTRAEVDKLFK